MKTIEEYKAWLDYNFEKLEEIDKKQGKKKAIEFIDKLKLESDKIVSSQDLDTRLESFHALRRKMYNFISNKIEIVEELEKMDNPGHCGNPSCAFCNSKYGRIVLN